jgi:hypothetical protein
VSAASVSPRDVAGAPDERGAFIRDDSDSGRRLSASGGYPPLSLSRTVANGFRSRDLVGCWAMFVEQADLGASEKGLR